MPEATPIANVEAASAHSDGAIVRHVRATTASVMPVRRRVRGLHPRRGTTISCMSMAPAALASSMRAVTETAGAGSSPPRSWTRKPIVI